MAFNKPFDGLRANDMLSIGLEPRRDERVGGIRLLLRLVAFGAVSSVCAGVEVTHYPRAVYEGEPFTFVAAGEPGTTLAARFDGVKLREETFAKEALEFNLTLAGPGILRFEGSKSSRSFAIVRPGGVGELVEREGHLYQGNMPAILLVKHRKPEPPNRRWFPIRYLIALMSDTRPAVRSGVIAVAGRGAGLGGAVPEGLRGVWKSADAPACAYGVHSLVLGARVASGADVVGARTAPEEDVVAIILSPDDEALGIDPLEYRMKLEWRLETLGGFKRVFVVSPVFEGPGPGQGGGLLHEIETACEAYGAVLVDMTGVGGAPGSKEWAERFSRAVERTVRWQ